MSVLESRTKKSIRNAQIALFYYLLNTGLQFISRKVFIDCLGTEVLGLNTTATNLLQFLNIAELGIGAAVSYSLYKPLVENDKKTISEIISIQGFLYNRIGWIIIALTILLLLFFPVIFRDITIPLWYSYATFSVLLLSALGGYFFNYNQVLIVADQKEYKLNNVLQPIKLVKILFQIILIYYLTNGYICWLILELVGAILTIYGLKYLIKIEYPWLNSKICLGKKLISSYPSIVIKTKQLFVHKISAFALTQCSPLIIFAFTSLSFIAIYGNYLLIITGVTVLIGAFFNSINAGVGSFVAEHDNRDSFRFFKELFTIRLFISILACYWVFKLANSFVEIWVGKEYLIDSTLFYLLVLIMYISCTRLTVDSFINAYGLFNDTWAPLVETILNIGLSILLGNCFGTFGVLSGVIVSQLIIVLGWKPYFLFSQGLKLSYLRYLYLYAILLLLSGFSIGISEMIFSYLHIYSVNSFSSFLYYVALICIISTIVQIVIYYLFSKDMRLFCTRIFSFLLFKIK